MIKKLVPAIIVLLIGLVAMKGLSSLKKPAFKKPTPIVTKSLSVTKVSFDDNFSKVEVLGKVEAKNRINLVSEVSGKIVWTSLKEGKSFRKGELLARVDSEIQKNSVKIRTSELLVAVVNMLPDIKIDISDEYAKWEKFANELSFDNIPALPKYNSSREKIFITKRGIFSQYYNLKNQKEMLKKYSVRAPFSGTVAMNSASVGAMVAPNAPLATIVNTASYEVKLPISQNVINKIKIGMVADVSLKSMNYATAGKVVRKTSVINGQNQTQYAIIEIKHKKGSPLLDGSYVSVSIKTDVIRSFKIKRSALFKDQYLIAVENIKEIKKKKPEKSAEHMNKTKDAKKSYSPSKPVIAGNAKLIKVSIDYIDDKYVYISNGINDGELVVTEPTQDIDNKTLITPIYTK